MTQVEECSHRVERHHITLQYFNLQPFSCVLESSSSPSLDLTLIYLYLPLSPAPHPP